MVEIRTLLLRTTFPSPRGVPHKKAGLTVPLEDNLSLNAVEPAPLRGIVVVLMICLLVCCLGGPTACERKQHGCLLILHRVYYFWIILCVKSVYRCYHRQLQSP